MAKFTGNLLKRPEQIHSSVGKYVKKRAEVLTEYAEINLRSIRVQEVYQVKVLFLFFVL